MSDVQLDSLKVPPHSVEAEQSVLGGLLMENSAWDRVADVLAGEDFYRNDHRLIFKHIIKLLEHAKPADAITVAESLENAGELQNVGGLPYIGALVQNTPSAANIRRYAEIIRERSVMRQLVTVGTDITESAFNPMGRNARQLLDEAEAKVFKIAEASSKGQEGYKEKVREYIRSQLWLLNEESGGIGWSVPEVIAEIITSIPELLEPYASIMITSALESQVLVNESLWAIGRLGKRVDTLVSVYREKVFSAFSSHNPETLGLLSWAMGEVGITSAIDSLKMLADRKEPVRIFIDGRFTDKSLGELASQAIVKINSSDT